MKSNTPDTLEGTWLPFKADFAGNSAPGMALAKMRLVIQDGTYAVYFGDEVSDAGSLKISRAGGGHATLTLVCSCGTNAGRTIPSIFQIVGDRLQVCYGMDGEMPTAFASSRGSRNYLVTYRRKG